MLTPPRQLHSLGGLNRLFEQMRQKWGDTLGYSLNVYPDFASLERTDPDDGRRALRYSYRGGWDDPSETSVRSDARVVNLAAFDVAQLVGLIRGAPERWGSTPPRSRAFTSASTRAATSPRHRRASRSASM